MHVERWPDEAFDRFAMTPVVIRPFDPASKRAALAYGERLNDRLSGPFHKHWWGRFSSSPTPGTMRSRLQEQG